MSKLSDFPLAVQSQPAHVFADVTAEPDSATEDESPQKKPARLFKRRGRPPKSSRRVSAAAPPPIESAGSGVELRDIPAEVAEDVKAVVREIEEQAIARVVKISPFELRAVASQIEGLTAIVRAIPLTAVEEIYKELLRLKEQPVSPLFGEPLKLDEYLALTSKWLEFRRALEAL